MSQQEIYVPSSDILSSTTNTSTTIPSLYPEPAPLPLDIIVVGCGLGGLAAALCLGRAGHKVRVVEQASAIGEVGAGIQVTPNVSRLLIRWGLGDLLEKVAVRPEGIVFRRFDNGEKVGYTKWGSSILPQYKAPYYHIHRADFHKLLFDAAAPFIDLHLGTTVTGVSVPQASPANNWDPKPVLTLKDGKTMTCDLVIGADGVKSLLRKYVLGGVPDAPRPTGDAAYRATLSTDFLLSDPELAPLVQNPEMTAWMGPGRHIMGYNVRAKKEYNLVLLHPDDGAVESWDAHGSSERMQKDFEDFEPRVRKLLSFIPSTLKWKLMDRAPLPTWIDPSSRVILMGDSCHPMLPYRAQGAAMAIEDAAVLGNIFSRISSSAQIAPFLQAFFQLRFPRATNTQLQSRLNQKIFHYEDGPEQEERDNGMREAMLAEEQGSKDIEKLTKGNPNQWADTEKSRIQFLYDADQEAENWWKKEGWRWESSQKFSKL